MTQEERIEYEKLADELDFKGNIANWKDETLKRKVDEALDKMMNEPTTKKSLIVDNMVNFEDKTFANTSNHPLKIGLQTIIHGAEFTLMHKEKTKKNIKILRRLYGWGWIKEA